MPPGADRPGYTGRQKRFSPETDDTRAVIVVVRHVPAQVCDRCGTTTVTDEVAEELARIADAQQGSAVSGTVVVDFDQRQIAAAG